MATIRVTAHVDADGELRARLPVDLPPGEIEISLEIPEPIWTDEELEELLRPTPPMTGKEIVEAGLLGGWEDENIVDGATWVEEQRRKHARRYTW